MARRRSLCSIVAFLLLTCLSPNGHGSEHFDRARNKLKVFEELLRRRRVLLCQRLGNLRILHNFVGAIPNATVESEERSFPLHNAVDAGDSALIQQLLEEGADPNLRDYMGQTPFTMACYRRDLVNVFFLLEYGGNPIQRMVCGMYPLSFAVEKENIGLTCLLLQGGANANIACKGEYPLHLAIRRQNIELTRLLLEYGANPDLRDSVNALPLYYLTDRDNFELTSLLLQYGANPNKKYTKNETRWSPLHHAAHSGPLTIASVLIQHGAELNAQSRKGSTPFMIAAQQENTPSLVFLALHGADVNQANNRSIRPLCMCEERETQETIIMLGGACDCGEICGYADIQGPNPEQRAARLLMIAPSSFPLFLRNDVSWLDDGPIQNSVQRLIRRAGSALYYLLGVRGTFLPREIWAHIAFFTMGLWDLDMRFPHHALK